MKEVLLDSVAIDSSYFLRANVSGNISRHYLIIPASSYQFSVADLFVLEAGVV